jgi:hypothetical protein
MTDIDPVPNNFSNLSSDFDHIRSIAAISWFFNGALSPEYVM